MSQGKQFNNKMSSKIQNSLLRNHIDDKGEKKGKQVVRLIYQKYF